MNKIIFFLCAALSFEVLATDTQFGRVVDLKGEGFISYKGKTRELKKGSNIEVGAEIVIEHHGQVTFTDNADHRFHLGNASSAAVLGNTLELRAGDLWFQSLNKNDDYVIKTANAQVNYQGGEAIISYDSMKGKTQLMVINGIMKLANLRAQELNLSVAEGHFSFIDNAYDEGAPRDPTPVGQKTYSDLVMQFSGISPLDKNSAAIFKEHNEAPVAHEEKKAEAPVRAVASVKDTKDQMLEDYKSGLLESRKSKKLVTNRAPRPKMTPEKTQKSAPSVLVHIYGMKKNTTVSNRAPASVMELDVPQSEEPKSALPYSNEYKKNVEGDKLIDALKKL